jgi:hypothetical protein
MVRCGAQKKISKIIDSISSVGYKIRCLVIVRVAGCFSGGYELAPDGSAVRLARVVLLSGVFCFAACR